MVALLTGAGMNFWNELRKLRQALDTPSDVRRERHAGPQGLHRRHAERVARGELGIGVIADHQHLARLPAAACGDLCKPFLLRATRGFVDRVDLDLAEKIADAERGDLALLQAPESGGHEK